MHWPPRRSEPPPTSSPWATVLGTWNAKRSQTRLNSCALPPLLARSPDRSYSSAKQDVVTLRRHSSNRICILAYKAAVSCRISFRHRLFVSSQDCETRPLAASRLLLYAT